jgi:hypothetical protein
VVSCFFFVFKFEIGIVAPGERCGTSTRFDWFEAFWGPSHPSMFFVFVAK